MGAGTPRCEAEVRLATVPQSVAHQRRLDIVRALWEEYERGGPAAASRILLANSHSDVLLKATIGSEPRIVRGHEEIIAALPESPLGVQGAKAYSFAELGNDVFVSSWVRIRENGGWLDAQVRWMFRFRGDKLWRVTTLPPVS
jgi:hypothetical protein